MHYKSPQTEQFQTTPTYLLTAGVRSQAQDGCVLSFRAHGLGPHVDLGSSSKSEGSWRSSVQWQQDRVRSVSLAYSAGAALPTRRPPTALLGGPAQVHSQLWLHIARPGNSPVLSRCTISRNLPRTKNPPSSQSWDCTGWES